MAHLILPELGSQQDVLRQVMDKPGYIRTMEHSSPLTE